MSFLWIFLILGLQKFAAGRLLLDFPDYCLEQFRCGTRMHLLCMNHKRNTGSKFCDEMLFETDQQLRQEIFHRVNSFRHILARGEIPSFPEGASNMRLVSWDYELEKMAEGWTWKYIDRLLAGENFTKPCTKTQNFKDGASILGHILGPDELAKDSVAIWTKKAIPDEVITHFRPDPSDSSYDQYATIAWAETFRMGCAITSCNNNNRLSQIIIIACLFGPKGNSPGKPVFKNGTACSNCPPKTKCKPNSVWPKLCALEEDFDHIDGPEELDFPVGKLIAFLVPLTSVISLIGFLIKLHTNVQVKDGRQKNEKENSQFGSPK